MPKSAARAEAPGSRNSGLASVASPQGLQAGRGGCLTAGSMPLLSLELAASPVHPLFQRLPRHPFGSTPHPEQPSIATNDSLGSQGWLATGPQGRAGPEWDAPPTPSHRSWGTKGPREAEARPTAASHTGLAGLSQGDMATSHSLQIGSGGRGLLQTVQLKASSSSVCSSSCEQSEVLNLRSAPHPALGLAFSHLSQWTRFDHLLGLLPLNVRTEQWSWEHGLSR